MTRYRDLTLTEAANMMDAEKLKPAKESATGRLIDLATSIGLDEKQRGAAAAMALEVLLVSRQCAVALTLAGAREPDKIVSAGLAIALKALMEGEQMIAEALKEQTK